MRVPAESGDLFLSLDNLAEAEIAGLELVQRLRAGRSQIQLAWTLQQASGRDAGGDSRDLAGRLRRKLGCDYELQLGGNPESGISFRADWQERYFDEDLLEGEEGAFGDDDEDDGEGEEAGAIGAPGEAWRYLVLGAGARWRLKPGMALQRRPRQSRRRPPTRACSAFRSRGWWPPSVSGSTSSSPARLVPLVYSVGRAKPAR